MLHLLSIAGFALQLHPRHLACFHTTNTCNYIALLFLAYVKTKKTKDEKGASGLEVF